MEFKNENVMDYTYFDDVEDLVSCVLDDLLEENQTVDIFCKEDLVKELIKNFLNINGIEPITIDFDTFEYSNEYLITLTPDLELFCEKAYRENGYSIKHFDDDVIYIHGDCSSEITKDVIGGNWTEFEFEYEVDSNDIPIDNDFLELNFTCDCCGLYVCISPIEEDEECELWTTEMYLEDESGTRIEIVERQSFEEVKAIRDEWIENFR